jgi:hypothetical protein
MRRSLVYLASATLLLGIGHGPVLAEGLVYWTDKGDDFPGIYRGDMDGSGPYEILLGRADGLGEPRGLGLDLAGGKMYWTDAQTQMVQRANLDGSHVQDLVVTDNGFLADLELDLQAGKIYWSDVVRGAIRRANLDGTEVEDVRTGLNSPYYLELDPAGGQIYFGEVENTMIHRIRMDGTGPVEDVVTGLVRVRDVGLDLAEGMIYWNDRNSYKVQRTRLDGTGPVEDLYTFIPQQGRPHGMALDLGARMIYWTDTRRDLKWIIRGSMDGGAPAEVLYSGLDDPWDVELHVIPEPATLLLSFVGLMVVAGCARWRLRSAARPQPK